MSDRDFWNDPLVNLVVGYMLLKLWSSGAMHTILAFVYGVIRWIFGMVGNASAWVENGLVTDEFDKPGIGPHVGMVIDVRPAGGRRSG